MIVPMKKVTLLTLEEEQHLALQELRNLGVMQINMAKTAVSEGTTSLNIELSEVRRAFSTLTKLAEETEPKKLSSNLSASDIVKETVNLLEQRRQINNEKTTLLRRQKELEVWGDFSYKSIEDLKNSGIYIYLCISTEKEFEQLNKDENFQCILISEVRDKRYFIISSTSELQTKNLPIIRVTADDDSKEIVAKLENFEKELENIEKKLAEFSSQVDVIEDYFNKLEADLEYSKVYDSLSKDGVVSYLSGFVPEPESEKLSVAAKKHGWGLLLLDPKADEANVPTLLKVHKMAKIINPLFKFLGIIPGYDELDVSVGVLIFFTIFYAMIVGDAGYGCVFLAISILGAWKFRNNKAAKLPIKLLFLLSIATIIWGGLSGNWFGTAVFPGLKILTDPAIKDGYTQAFCFLLALLQLSLARVWRAFYDKTLKSFIRNIGWMLVLWGNFFFTIRLVAWPGDFPTYMYYFYAIGLLCVIVSDVNWKNPADIFQFPFNIINSFVDVLSYIRLFAVGMAGYYIALSFNNMGMDIYKMSPWLVLGAIIVILFGHLLNISLCIMGVLVHGVRLNTLEFSSHIGLRWGGTEFKPFKNNIKKSEEN